MKKPGISRIAFILVFALLLSSCSAKKPVDPSEPHDGPEQFIQEDDPATQPEDGRKTDESDESVRTYTDYTDFGIAVSELVQDNQIEGSSTSAAAADEFYSRRLIVQASRPIDFARFNPSDCIAGPDHLYIVQFASSDEAKDAYDTLAAMSEVIYVEPDGYSQADAGPQSAAASKSWGVSAIGADKLAAHMAAGRTGSIIVAVVDTGVSDHAFLRGRIASGGYDFVENDDTPDDVFVHGTHVAGTVVDCTPGLDVQILPVRVLGDNGFGSSSIIGTGIRYAADHGAKVINLSLGGDHSEFKDASVQYAIKKGVCVVASAGNNQGNAENCCPAHCSAAITVGAVDSNLRKAVFSNTGSCLDLVCPGVDINSCVPGGGFRYFDGTSMAAPHASAAVAMIRLLDPSLTPEETQKLLCFHTTDLGDPGWDESYGAGLPDLAQFVSSGSVLPTGISISDTAILLPVGGSQTLTAVVSPSDAADKTVSWSSSDPSVAAVTGDGTVSAKAAGTATITAATVNGLTASCGVTVEAASAGGIVIASGPDKTFYYVGEELDPSGLALTVTKPDGSPETVTSGYTCSPVIFDFPGTRSVTVSYQKYQTTFDVWVESPAISLDIYNEFIKMNCWDSYWNPSRGVPLWKLPLPVVTTSPSSGSVSWSIVSGEAYLAEDYIAAQQPGTVVARASYTYLDHTYTADFSVTLSIYKTTTDINYLQSAPTLHSDILLNVPNGATVDISEVAWDASVQASDGLYYLWGKTIYNGVAGWIVIS